MVVLIFPESYRRRLLPSLTGETVSAHLLAQLVILFNLIWDNSSNKRVTGEATQYRRTLYEANVVQSVKWGFMLPEPPSTVLYLVKDLLSPDKARKSSCGMIFECNLHLFKILYKDPD